MHVVLYQPEIPQNTGNIGRTCVALDAKLWLVQPLGFRLDDRRLQRAGLDYWQHLQWEMVSDWQVLEERLGQEGNWWFFSKRGQRDYSELRYGPDDVLVFGSESQGLPESLLAQYRNRSVYLPQSSRVRSLNLANAVAVALYHATGVANRRPGMPSG